jgi:hypothetical protein
MSFFHDKGFIYISEKYKLIFIPIPKNGSTTIRKLDELGFIQGSLEKYKDVIENYIVFSVIRNPLSRLVSSYTETILRA